MKRARRAKRKERPGGRVEEARELLLELLEDGAHLADEVPELHGELDPLSVARAVLLLLREGVGDLGYAREELGGALNCIDLELVGDEVLDLLGDARVSVEARSLVYGVLLYEVESPIIGDVPHSVASELGQLAAMSQMEATLVAEVAAEQVASLLLDLEEPAEQDAVFSFHDQARRAAAVPALVAYRMAILDASDTLFAHLAQAIAGEGGQIARRGLELLLELADEAEQPRLRSLLEQTPEAPQLFSELRDVTGWITGCNGAGPCVVLLEYRSPTGRCGLTFLLIPGAELLDAELLWRSGEEELTELREGIEEGGLPLVAIAPGEAVGLVLDAALATGREPDADPLDWEVLLPAAILAERLARAQKLGPATVTPASDVDQATAASLLARPDFTDSWYFDAEDLRAGVDADGRQLQLADLEPAQVGPRLVAQARFHAKYLELRGETEAAAQLLGLAAATERDFGSSPLVLAMLEYEPREPDVEDFEGEPEDWEAEPEAPPAPAEPAGWRSSSQKHAPGPRPGGRTPRR